MNLSPSACHLVWFRQDLRVADHPALAAAMALKDAPAVAVFALDEAGPWKPGGASRWWLHHSLTALAADLARLNVPLVLRRGDAALILPDLARSLGARSIHWNRQYEPYARARDEKLKAAFKSAGMRAESYNGALLFEPWTIKTQTGGSYRVYTPFSRACFAAAASGQIPALAPVPAPQSRTEIRAGDALADWNLEPSRPDWAGGLRKTWLALQAGNGGIGSAGAMARLADFLDGAIGPYTDQRNRPDLRGTSHLSPALHWGELSPRQVWQAVSFRLDGAGATAKEGGKAGAGEGAALAKGGETYRKELLWREFAYHLLFHNPDLPEHPLDKKFAAFPWARDDAALALWQRGLTGYPIVDAGMRELWQTGWMHNRVRMIVASFLVKNLLLPWRAGEDWFWDTLVDADLASNAASWQWVAGCGADAAPYFRIFNPVLQGEKFDPEGAYVRTYVPELARLPASHIHKPWAAPPLLLAEAGVALGKSYPPPMVDLAVTRDRALAAYATIKDAAR